jgi:Rrf2 family transcriptional regulator, cysteine metabolism repressor
MNLSQKCQYALRAVFELATRHGQGPIPVGQIAEQQGIPARFLELILVQLKQAGYIESRRGVQGGYNLSVAPKQLSIGDVIRTIEGPLLPVRRSEEQAGKRARPAGDHAFSRLWERAEKSVADVYDTTSFQDLIDEDKAAKSKYTADFSI